MLLNCAVREDFWESLGLQGGPTSPSWRRSVLGVHWKDWCWRWNSNTLATWCEELTHLKRPWCWERLRAGREGDDRGWDGWMASPTQWTWVWVNSGSWWWTGRLGVLRFMGSQGVGHDWATELNWSFVFAFISMILRDGSKKMLLQFTSESILAMSSSRSFIMSALTLRSLIHFELIFVYVVKEWSNLIFYMWLSHFPRTICWRDCLSNIV